MTTLNPTVYIAAISRWLQAHRPQQALRGLWRLQHLLKGFPPYKGVISLSDGLRLEIDTSGGGTQRWIFYSGIHQVALTNLLHQQVSPGHYCIDVGSHIGFYTVKFAHWTGPTGHVAAFEANPEMATRTRRNVELNKFSNVDIVNKAVHSESGILRLYVAPHTALGMSSVVPGVMTDAVETIDIEAISIDVYMEQHARPSLDLLKIDAESNDLNIILGARATLSKFRPFIVFEWRPGSDSALEQQVFEFLHSRGYVLQILGPREKFLPFDYQKLQHIKGHADVICWPPKGYAR